MYNDSQTGQEIRASASQDAPSKLGMRLLTWLIILTVIGYFGFIALTTHYLREQRISVSEVLGRDLPSEYMDSLTLKTDDGKVSQFFLPEKNLKFSIAFSQRQDNMSAGNLTAEILPQSIPSPYQFIKDYVSKKSPDKSSESSNQTPLFLVNFAKSQFNFLRAKFISSDVVNWRGSQISTDSVSVKDEQFYRLGFLKNERGHFFMVAFTMNQEIKKEDFEAVLGLIN